MNSGANSLARRSLIFVTTRRLAVHELSSPNFAEHFQRLEHGGAFGYTQDTIWLRTRLQRAKDA